MKHLIAIVLAAAMAVPANAGGMAEPIIEPEVMAEDVVVAESAAGSGGFVVPLLILAVIAAVASNGGGSECVCIDIDDCPC